MNLTFVIFLRIVHVFAGTLWIGAVVFYLFFVKPSVKAIGPAGPQFMQNLAVRRKYPLFMSIITTLTILAGILLYQHASGGFSLGWIRSGTGLGFTIGAAAAFVSYFIGMLGIGPTSGKLSALGQQIGAAGGTPTPEQAGRLHALEARLTRIEQVDFWVLLIALLTMATARYWVF